MKRLMLAALPVILLSGCQAEGQAETGAKEKLAIPVITEVRVETASVSPSVAEVEMSFPAVVEAVEDVTLAASLGGLVESVTVKAGSTVKKNELIAKVDSGTRSAQYEVAKAQMDQAIAERDRTFRLGNGVSESQRLAATTQSRVAKANAKLARLNRDKSAIRAPFAGTIADVWVDAGEVAPPGGQVARLVRIDEVLLTFSVPDRDIALVKTGQEVSFHTQASPVPLMGRVSYRGVAADPKSRTFDVEVRLANPDRLLLPGMIGRVTFDRVVAQDAIVIPQEWLVTKRDGTGVFVAESNVAKWRDIEIGAYARDQVVISDGLRAGDFVVTVGHRNLAEGDKLLVAREGACCTDGRVSY